jgi:hypothetical protein
MTDELQARQRVQEPFGLRSSLAHTPWFALHGRPSL